MLVKYISVVLFFLSRFHNWKIYLSLNKWIYLPKQIRLAFRQNKFPLNLKFFLICKNKFRQICVEIGRLVGPPKFLPLKYSKCLSKFEFECPDENTNQVRPSFQLLLLQSQCFYSIFLHFPHNFSNIFLVSSRYRDTKFGWIS